MATKDEDEIKHLISASTHDSILFFTDRGRVFGTKAWDITEGSRQSKGQALVNIINLEQGEEIKSILPLGPETKYLIMATSNVTIKKTATTHFQNLRANGLIAIKLDKFDALISFHPTTGNNYVLLFPTNTKPLNIN